MTLGAISQIFAVEGTDVILVDRPRLPNGADLIQSYMAGGTDYTVEVYDLSSATPTVDLFTVAEAGTSATTTTSNFPQGGATEPVVYTAVAAPTATYGGLWTQDATGYSSLFVILQSELSAAMEGGHIYLAEMRFTTTVYGPIYARWIIHCLPLLGA